MPFHPAVGQCVLVRVRVRVRMRVRVRVRMRACVFSWGFGVFCRLVVFIVGVFSASRIAQALTNSSLLWSNIQLTSTKVALVDLEHSKLAGRGLLTIQASHCVGSSQFPVLRPSSLISHFPPTRAHPPTRAPTCARTFLRMHLPARAPPCAHTPLAASRCQGVAALDGEFQLGPQHLVRRVFRQVQAEEARLSGGQRVQAYAGRACDSST